MRQIITNSTTNGVLQSVFAVLVIVVVVNAAVVVVKALRAGSLPTTEEPHTTSRQVEPAGLFATPEEKVAIAAHEEHLVSGGQQ